MMVQQTIKGFITRASELSGDRYIKNMGGIVFLRKENQPKEGFLT